MSNFQGGNPPNKLLRCIKWKTIKPHIVSHFDITIEGCIDIAVQLVAITIRFKEINDFALSPKGWRK